MKVTIYSTSICAACVTLENWLDKNNVSYEKKITDTDPLVMAEFLSVNDGRIGVPFTVIESDDGKVNKISGFNQPEFKKLLNIS